MENYAEQSVAGAKRAKDTALYALCWALTALLVLLAMFFAAGALGEDPNRIEISWRELLLSALCLLAALAVFRMKDHLRREYDYILRGDVLQICLILNGRRRRELVKINLERVTRMGAASGTDFADALRQTRIRRQNWFADAGAPLYYLCYTNQNERCVAVLQLNEELLGAIRLSGRLPRGAWRDPQERICS